MKDIGIIFKPTHLSFLVRPKTQIETSKLRPETPVGTHWLASPHPPNQIKPAKVNHVYLSKCLILWRTTKMKLRLRLLLLPLLPILYIYIYRMTQKKGKKKGNFKLYPPWLWQPHTTYNKVVASTVFNTFSSLSVSLSLTRDSLTSKTSFMCSH